jgi:hypothetical protein
VDETLPIKCDGLVSMYIYLLLLNIAKRASYLINTCFFLAFLYVDVKKKKEKKRKKERLVTLNETVKEK